MDMFSTYMHFSLKLLVPEFSEEEKQQILNSEDFTTFFNKSTRLVERMLTEDMDIFTDYSGGDGEGKDE